MSSRVASPNDARSGRMTRSSTARARLFRSVRVGSRSAWRSASIISSIALGWAEVRVRRAARACGRRTRRSAAARTPRRSARPSDRTGERPRIPRARTSSGIAACTASSVTGCSCARNSALRALSSASSRSFCASTSLMRVLTILAPSRSRSTPAVRAARSSCAADRACSGRPGPRPAAARRRGYRSWRPARALCAAAGRGPRARWRPGSPAASWRLREIVRSVRFDTLLTNASFWRSEPTARLSASCVSTMASVRR